MLKALKFFSALAIPAVSIFPVTSVTAQKSPSPTCQKLKADWLDVEMELASLHAGWITDNSRYGSLARETAATKEMTRAQGILELLKAHKCPLPTRPASEDNFLINALGCEGERDKGIRGSPKCDRKRWTPALDY